MFNYFSEKDKNGLNQRITIKIYWTVLVFLFMTNFLFSYIKNTPTIYARHRGRSMIFV